MAVEIGTATSAQDLYDKLIAFLTTNVDLVAANQEWTVAWNTPSALENQTDIVLKGPGLSQQDSVFVGLRLYQDVPADSYWIQCRGMTGVLPNGTNYSDHVNATPNYVRMFLAADTMSYWFVADGRRFMVVVKISTIFEAMYAGLFLPYATPQSYAYPMFIGGSAGDDYDSSSPKNWRDASVYHTHFVSPRGGWTSGSRDSDTNAWMIDPLGAWKRVANWGNSDSWNPCCIGPEQTHGQYPFARQAAAYFMNRLMDGYGGDRALIPCTLIQTNPTDQTYGVLDGAYRCQGYNNAAENLITVDAVDHLVIQNVFRTDTPDFWAMVME